MYKKIQPEIVKEKMDQKEEMLIVDVRMREEYGDGHIEGSINIPNETIQTIPPQELKDKDANIYIYCRSGNRSKKACDKLIQMGYTHVYDFGGLNTWPYSLVK